MKGKCVRKTKLFGIYKLTFHVSSLSNKQGWKKGPPAWGPFIYVARAIIFRYRPLNPVRGSFRALFLSVARILPSSGPFAGFCQTAGIAGAKKTAPIVGSLLLFTIFCTYIGFCLGARIRRMLRLCSSNVGLKTWRLVLSATKYKLLKLGVGCKTPKTDS